MDSDFNNGDDPPPRYEEVIGEEIIDEESDSDSTPIVLILSNKSIHIESAPERPLYRMNQSVTQLAYTGTSIKFERIEYNQPPEKPGSNQQPPIEQSKHLYYIVHPENAQYRKDVPAAYYITSAATETPGNIRFDTSSSSKRPLQRKPEFKALLSAGKHMWNDPLFNEESQVPLFTVKQSWKGGGYKWATSDGRQVAIEDGKGEESRLIVSTPIQPEMRDALVAMWVLRVWYENAETRQAKRDSMFSPYPP
ncbi:hypothetical protein FQN55_003672 [Onygenales sp. PD_40]|nr:hypothetical protein FQN55_003672 [Onygenales sp. PD_40]